MISSRHIFLGLFPALVLVSLFFTFRVFQYHALFGKANTDEQAQTLDFIPIMPNDPIIGSPNAPITVVAFEDLACEACRAQDSLLKTVQETHPGKVKIIWKGLPFIPFPYPSEVAHEYAFCAQKQGKFSAFKEFALVNYTNLSPGTLETIAKEIELDEDALMTCLDSDEGLAYIEQTRLYAQKLNIQSVPTFFVNNAQIQTPDSASGWEAVLGL